MYCYFLKGIFVLIVLFCLVRVVLFDWGIFFVLIVVFVKGMVVGFLFLLLFSKGFSMEVVFVFFVFVLVLEVWLLE